MNSMPTNNLIIGLDDFERKCTLISQDGEKFEVDNKVASLSNLVKTMIDGDKGEKEIPVPNVKSDTLKLVIKYLSYHVNNPPKEIEKPLISSQMHEVVSQWDSEFIDMSQEQLFDVILAANYMDIKYLLDLACAKVASLIKGKTPEQIRKTFNIVNDFTPEEEITIIAENKWAEEASKP